MSRLHPSAWPLWLWVAASVLAGLLRVDYTLGSFSFSPAVALLAGTWLGSRRGALSQAVTAVMVIPLPDLLPDRFSHGEWGFRIGLIGAAALAGMLCRPDDTGAHPPRWVRRTVLAGAAVSAALVMSVLPRVVSGQTGVLFALSFLLGTGIAVFYAYKMVPEPRRVIGYAFCLIPYYAAGLTWTVAAVWLGGSAATGVPQRARDIVFHGYLAHLPGDLIALVVIAYLVCAVDRHGTDSGPLAIGASR